MFLIQKASWNLSLSLSPNGVLLMVADSIKTVSSDEKFTRISHFISPGSNLETPCMALSDGPSEPIQPHTRVISRLREDAIRHEGVGATILRARAQGSATDFCGQIGPALGSWRAVSRSARSVASVVHHRPPY